eukprot:TRINITY_DN22300_c0_g1_i1.p1 TRINITY_DN22300_c0_g1~~TRINITY_DN22300_c0_g1_i1.p1  ORF type:complete len:682 (+),score=91.49 TRINITY_DN22300_c0_g1_i1:46-2046(+)
MASASSQREDMAQPLRGNADGPVSPSFALMRQQSFGFERAHSDGCEEEGRPIQTMEWNNLTFGIGNKTILKDMTGLITPGRLTCVLGPSGSGKSTLMNVLAGRQKVSAAGMTFTGAITAGGRVIDPVDFRSNVAYVMQDDALLATETPRECLSLSAQMRLPTTVPAQERKEFVEQLLNSLQLNKCADTCIGSALIKGISGGERKRTAVGIELITNPKLLFLDEPLSGLDSYAAFTLVQALKELASTGVPVLCTVHQPSSEIFSMFDDVILLHDGETVYHGSVQELASHFEQLGYPCPANFNPADHVMFTIQKEGPEKIASLKQAWKDSKKQQSLVDKVANAQQCAAQNAGVTTKATPTFSFCSQLIALLRREGRAIVRNKGVIIARFGMASFLSILYAWLFAGTASAGDKSQGPCTTSAFDPATCAGDFQAHYGTLVSLAISAMMGSAQPLLLTFPVERPVFLREYAAQQYGVVPYFVAKTLVEAPVVFCAQLITFLISYWVMGLQGNFAVLVIYGWLLGIASSSLALIVSCGVASAEKAIQFAPLVLLPQMLFSGLFVPVGKIPSSLRWVRYLCPLKYSIDLLEITEFRYVKSALDDCSATYGEQKCYAAPISPVPGAALQNSLLGSQSVEWADEGFALLMVVALFFAFRIIATYVLWRKGRYVF